jgi:ATP-dependent Clp protease ATP-binding subunit ClpA
MNLTIMFDRYTDRARRVVILAQEEARCLNHNYIGTEHVLLGLIHEGHGVAAQVLGSLGIELQAIRKQVEEIIGHGQQAPQGHIPFTPRAKKVMELALREALQLGHNHIGTEHLLLALIREGQGVGAQVLHQLGADLDSARQQVLEKVGKQTTVRVSPLDLRAEVTEQVKQVLTESKTGRLPHAELYDHLRDLERRLEDMDIIDYDRVVTEHSSGQVAETLTIRWRR